MRTAEIKTIWSAFVESRHVDWTWRVHDALYSEPHRAYHNLAHIGACLELANEARREEDFSQPAVELALLWHDAVYVPGDKRNEDLSASLLQSLYLLSVSTHASDIWEAAHVAILATKNHETVADNMESAITIDIDLSILGSDSSKYRKYVRDIRKEYATVSNEAWRNGRAGFLKGILNRERIFQTKWGRDRFEEKARTNMRAELEELHVDCDC